MATEATIQRWDRILGEVEIKRRCFVVPLEVLVPGHPRFHQGFQVTVDALTNDFIDAWESDHPVEGSALHAVLQPVVRAAGEFDFNKTECGCGVCLIWLSPRCWRGDTRCGEIYD
jgi:hypothetical protein